MAINVGDPVKLCDAGVAAFCEFVGRDGVVIEKALGADKETLFYKVSLNPNGRVQLWASRRMLAKLETA